MNQKESKMGGSMLHNLFTTISELPDFTHLLSQSEQVVVSMTAGNFDSDEIAKKLECDFTAVNISRAKIYKAFNDFVGSNK